jgi:outer membrane protein assembly factor BamB
MNEDRLGRIARAAFESILEEDPRVAAPAWVEIDRRRSAVPRPRRRAGWLVAVGAAVGVSAVLVAVAFLRTGPPSASVVPSSTLQPGPSTTTPTTSITTNPSSGRLEDLWEFQTQAIGRYLGSGEDFIPAAERVAVLTGEEAEGMAILDLESGRVLREFRFPRAPGTLLAFDGDQVVWATYESVGVNSEGGVGDWSHDFGDDRWADRGVTVDGSILVGLDPVMEGDFQPPGMVRLSEEGAVLWSTDLAEVGLDEDFQWVDFVVVGETLLVQTTKAVYGLETETGEQIWRVPFLEASVEHFSAASVVVSGRNVFVGDSGPTQGQILGIDIASGQVSLERATGPNPRIVGAAQGWLIYVEGSGIGGLGLDESDDWFRPIGEGSLPGVTAALVDTGVMVVSSDGLEILQTDGQVLRSLPSSDFENPTGSPALLGGVALVPTVDRTTALDLVSGEVIAQWPVQFSSSVEVIDQRRALVTFPGESLKMIGVED